MLLYGDFQPKMRTQYTAQYNFTIQRELAKDIVLQLGYVGSQGHRLLASHDINAANPQTCLGHCDTSVQSDPTRVSVATERRRTCGPFAEDNQFSVTVPAAIASTGHGGTCLRFTGAYRPGLPIAFGRPAALLFSEL